MQRSVRTGQMVAYLPLFHFEAESLDLLLQPALSLFALLDVLLKLRLQFLARSLELLQLDLQRLVLGLVVGELFLDAAPLASRGRRGAVSHGAAATSTWFAAVQEQAAVLLSWSLSRSLPEPPGRAERIKSVGRGEGASRGRGSGSGSGCGK